MVDINGEIGCLYVSVKSFVCADTKLHCYIPCRLIGAVDPSKALSVTLDVGTNNDELLDDPLYVVSNSCHTSDIHQLIICFNQGWRNKRVRGEEYDKFVDK